MDINIDLRCSKTVLWMLSSYNKLTHRNVKRKQFISRIAAYKIQSPGLRELLLIKSPTYLLFFAVHTESTQIKHDQCAWVWGILFLSENYHALISRLMDKLQKASNTTRMDRSNRKTRRILNRNSAADKIPSAMIQIST